MALLEVDSLSKRFPIKRGLLRRVVGYVEAVQEVSFSLERGKTLGIVGESGSGKSTLAQTVLRLTEPSSGKILFLGENLTEKSEKELLPLRPKMQIVFQDPMASLNPRRSVGESVGEAYRYHKLGKESAKRVVEALETVRLSPKVQSAYPHELSGGQLQRICLARALILRPELLVLDEVTSALDVSVQAQIIQLLVDLQQEFSLSYLFITHDLTLLPYLCHDTLVMKEGRVIEQGSCREIIENPKNPYTLRLIEALPGRDLVARAKKELSRKIAG